MAQPGSALAWGARGRGFESRRPDRILERTFYLVITLTKVEGFLFAVFEAYVKLTPVGEL